jgi:NAD(P)-dependent dehydrogenase (short-subunit alcohol dehydrogenase family)
MKKNILITGANRGIGFETARQLGKLGHLIILSARNENRLAEAVEQLKAEGVDSSGLVMDVGNEASISQAAAAFRKEKIRLDVLINNAAILSRTDKSLLTDEDSMQVETLTTNSLGPLRVCKAFLASMNKPSRIINISSGGGSMSDPVGGWAPAYCISKTLLNAITRQLAYELMPEGIAVNAVCPGWVKTKMGGSSAPRPVSTGAATPVWLATEAPQQLSGKFFRDKSKIPW